MNARATPPLGPLSAHQLAAMPFTETRRALAQQEVTFMNANHAKRLLAERKLDDEGIGRVVCVSLFHESRQFAWDAFPECGACGTTGEVVGEDGKACACPGCTDGAWGAMSEQFFTDYDGRIIEECA